MRIYMVLLAALLAAIMLFASCGQNSEVKDTAEPSAELTAEPSAAPSPEPIAFAEKHLKIIEPEAFGPVINDNARNAELEGVAYWISKKQAEADALVRKQAELMAYLNGKGFDTAGATVYIIPQGSDYSDHENRAAHIAPESVGTPAAVRSVLGALLGDHTNAGYLYALAERISAELGYEGEAPAAEPDETVFENSPILLNLAAPCFMEEYCGAPEREACMALARKLLNEMTDPYSGEAEFVGLIGKYAEEKGIGFAPLSVKFAYNGKTCPIKVLTSDLNIYLSSDYKKLTPEDHPESDYDPMFDAARMMAWFNDLDAFTVRLRELFKIEKDEYLDVHLTDTYADMGLTGGAFFYYGTKKQICAREFDSIEHEYTHYLYSFYNEGQYDDVWNNEVLAYWYGQRGTFEYHQQLISLDEYNGEYWAAVLGEEYDTPEDFKKLTDISAAYVLLDNGRSGLRSDLMKYLGGSYAKVSFAGYFIETYGEESFVACMLEPVKAKSLIGIEIEDAAEDWMDRLPELTEEQIWLLSD